jgi:hypothetical protein
MKLTLKLALLVAIMMLAINSGYLSEPIAQVFTQVAIVLIAILALFALVITYPLATIGVIAIVVAVEYNTDRGMIGMMDDVGITDIIIEGDCVDNGYCADTD